MAGFYRRVASVSGAEARTALWAEALRGQEAAEAARELEEVVRAAWSGEPAGLAAYLPLLDLPGIALRVGSGRLAAVLMAAREEELEACLLLLEDPGRHGVSETLGPPPDPLLESLTLGHRKAAARGPRNPLLERLLKDPDPRVVAEVLRNPRLREGEVLAIASRRPCPEEVFWLLVRSETWVRRPAVRRAVVLNPYAPPRLAVPLLVTLSRSVVAKISERESTPKPVRAGALQLLGWRRSGMEGEGLARALRDQTCENEPPKGEEPMFKRIDHVEIVPGDLERSIRFYSDALGFRLKSRHAVSSPPMREVVYLVLGDSMLELLSGDPPAPKSAEPWQVGYRNMALEVEDMDEALKALAEKGVKPTWGPADLGSSKRAEIRDPDGLTIELREWK